MVAGGLDHLLHAIHRADIAGIDTQAGGPGLGGLDPALVMEMDVGDERDPGGLRDGAEGSRGVLVRTGHAHEIGARLLAAADLVDRRPGIGRRRVRHRLDADWRVAADLKTAHADGAALAPFDHPPGANAAGVPIGLRHPSLPSRPSGAAGAI